MINEKIRVVEIFIFKLLKNSLRILDLLNGMSHVLIALPLSLTELIEYF